MEIVADAKRSLKKHRVDQWQGDYPTAAAFEQDVANKELYVLCHGEDTAGFLMVTARPEPSYVDITDGKWSSDAPYCVMHRTAVAAEYRGSGMAEYLVRCAEDISRKSGVKYLRVDTHRKNKPMQQLLRDNGFRYRGNIQVTSEPGHDPARQAYEKILK